MLCLPLASALALAGPRVEQSVVVDAPPEVFYGLVADMAAWGDWSDIGPGVDRLRTRVRGGDAYTDDQVMLWTGAGMGSGKIDITEVADDSVAFDLVRTGPAAFGVRSWTRWRQSTQISWAAEGDTTRVTWSTRTRNITAPAKNVNAVVEEGLTALAAAAVDVPEAPTARPETVLTASPALALWQGYKHRWSYNHRINRMGGWVSAARCADETCDVDLVHAAASGTGNDEATFDRSVAVVRAPELRAHSGTTTLWFQGREGSDMSDSACIPVPGTASGAAVLAGFDVDALESPDMLWGLALEVDREQVEGHEVVCVEGRMRMACRSVDCRRGSRTAYIVNVHWAHVTAPGLVATPTTVAQEPLEWGNEDIRDMLHARDYVREATLQGTPGKPVAAVGISALEVSLEHAYHTLGMDIAVRAGAYRPESGAQDVEVELFYKQWGPVGIAPLTYAQFSKTGSAELSAELTLLQLDAGCTTTFHAPGTLFWPGGNIDGSGPEAEASHTVSVPAVCE